MYSRIPTALAAAALLLAACDAPASRESVAELRNAAQVAGAFVAVQEQPHVTRPAPAPPRTPRELAPPIIRGIYVNAYAAGHPKRLGRLLALTDSTELNAWVVDVKDEDGVRYRSDLPLAREATHERSIPIRDLRALVDTLRAHQIHPIARVVVFKDLRLSKVRPDWSIKTPEGALWRDKVGNTWVSPWDRRVWEHNIAIAEEAVRAGFREVQFDYVRFPEAYRSLPRQVHAHAGGDRTDAIAAFLTEARARLHPLGATVTADVFGLSMNEARDVGIGQQWERLAVIADGLLPMVYPSHYFPTHLAGIRRPNRMPYETVHASVAMGVVRNRRLGEAGAEPARIVPWLQAFTATWNDKGFRYGPEQARAQMRAVHDLGLEDWILWHPGSNYDQVAGAFHPTTEPLARPFEPSAATLASVDRFDRDGVRALRDSVAAPSRLANH